MAPQALGDLVERSADPQAARTALRRIDGEAVGRANDDPAGAGAHLVRVVAASRSLTRLLESDPGAIDVLGALDVRPPLPEPGDVEGLVRWKAREILRIAARDLSGLDGLEATTAALALLILIFGVWALRFAGCFGGPVPVTTLRAWLAG